MFIKKREKINEIKDVVSANAGVPIEDFLSTEKEYKIKNIEKAKDIILKHLHDKITIVGDYDCDGICASAIMKIAINKLGGKNVTVRLPKRFSEGYGLSEKIVDEIDEGLLITVDNGITAFDAIEKAKEKGLTVLLTDHHLPAEDGRIPNADLIINPNAIPDSADFSGYCGAGIAYKICELLLSSKYASLATKLKSLAAIATVADVMPLVEENRSIVKNGLVDMTKSAGRTAGLGALLKLLDLNFHINEKNIGFKIGPIINAPGRLFDNGAERSFKLISNNHSLEEAQEDAAELIKINEERKSIKEKELKIIEQNIVDNCLIGDNIFVIYEPELTEGLVGIYAGNIAEKYGVPCFVLTNSDDPEILKGSGRTAKGINIKTVLDEKSALLVKYGGHAEAAGISVKMDDFEDFRAAMLRSVPKLDEASDDVFYDIETSVENMAETLDELAIYAPYGQGNPEIVFLFKDFVLSPSYGKFFTTLGDSDQHLKLFGKGVTAIGFGMTEKYIKMGMPKKVDIVGTVNVNWFMGKSTTQIEIIDFVDSSTFKTTELQKLLTEMATKRYNS